MACIPPPSLRKPSNILAGSYAWCIADPGVCTNTIYGYRTWTDGPVAISYLVDLLKLPLKYDFAIGHKSGGSKFGATINNTYTNSTAGVPAAVDQIKNYTSHATYNANIAKNLHFLWIGANDINLLHINVGSTNNSKFATQFSTQLASAVQTLLNDGAKYVFVPNLYPKQISPSSEFYASTATQLANLGSAIEQANTAIEAALKPFGAGVLYYDAYTTMMNIWNNHDSYNITHVGGEFCDGYSQADWDLCVTEKKGYEFYWMQYLDMTTYVHQFIAKDMFAKIKAHTW